MSIASPAYWYMEDCRAGMTFTAEPVTVTAEEIVAFAQQFDPQPFHLDDTAARTTIFGGLIASGWHTSSLVMRRMLACLPPMEGGMIGRRIETLDWPRPLRAGDSLHVHCEIKDVRATRNPERGLMRLKTEAKNQHGETVLLMEALIFIPRRLPTI